MALRKPIVQVGGLLQQLQSTDTLDAPAIAGGDVVVLTNNNAGALVIGTPVYSVANDACDKAQANAAGTKKVVGLVTNTSVAASGAASVQLNGLLTATTAQWDAAFGTSGGLVKDTDYWLSAATAGQGSATAPSTVGQYIKHLGQAISTTELIIHLWPDILL